MSEVHTSEQFSGPNGQLLRATLERTGVNKSTRIGFVNAVVCVQPRTANRNKDKKEMTKCIPACRDRLVNAIFERKPKLILALGGFAMQALMNDNTLKIMKCMGTIFFQPETEVPIVPVLHPAATMHNGAMFKDFELGIQNATDFLNNAPAKDPGDTKFTVVDKFNWMQVQHYIEEKVKETRLVASDIETTGLKYINGDRIKQIGLCFERNKVLIVRQDSPYLQYIKWLLEMPKKTLRWIWHNGKFDAGFIRYCWKTQARVDEDTMLMHYALDERKGTHDLEVCAVNFLGAPRWSDVMLPFWKDKKDENDDLATVKDEAPQEVLDKYHAFDCDYTWQLFHYFHELHKQDRPIATAYQHVLIPGSEFLMNLERNGFWVNKDYHDTVAQSLAHEIEEVTNTINDSVMPYWDPQQYCLATGAKREPEFFNVASPKQLQWILYDRMKFKPANRRKNTRAETLASIETAHDLPTNLLKSRKLRKLQSTYVEGLYKYIAPVDGRVHTNMLLHGTVTGRRASRNPNLQNIPRGSMIRNLFQAPEGRMLIEADYKSAELRCLCYLSRDVEMRRIFIAGLDLHDEMALEIFGAEYDKEDRVAAKTVNFGIPYGRGAFDIARVFKVDVSIAQSWINTWFKRFPQAAQYIFGCRSAVTEGRVLISPFGRKRRFQLTTAELLNHQQNEAVNFAISSMSGDLTLLSGVELDPIMRDYDTFCVNEVHDSLIWEAPRDTYVEQARHLSRVMCSKPLLLPNGDFVPFEVEIKIGQSWGDLKVLDPKEYV